MKATTHSIPNGHICITLEQGQYSHEFYLHRMEQQDRRHMAMRIRLGRSVVRRMALALTVPAETNEQISLF